MLKRVLKPILLAGLILTLLFGTVVTAQSETNIEIWLDGEKLEVEGNITNGRVYVESDALESETGLEVEQEPEVALRSFFEERDALVVWDSRDKAVRIYDDVENYSATELLGASSEVMLTRNTAQLESSGVIEYDVDLGEELGEEFGIEELQGTAELGLSGMFSYNPLEMHMEQGIEDDNFGSFVLETAFIDGVSYQKMPQLTGDVWLESETEEDFDVSEIMEFAFQTDPVALMQIAEELGAEVYFGDTVELEGTQYKTVNVELDDAVLEAVVNEFVADEELAGLYMAMLDNVEINSLDQYFINPDTLVVDHMNEEAELSFAFDGSMFEEIDMDGEVTGNLNITTETQITGVGDPIDLPEITETMDIMDLEDLYLQ